MTYEDLTLAELQLIEEHERSIDDVLLRDHTRKLADLFRSSIIELL